ncbi:peptidase A4 family protein [Seiridium cupressi]
MKLSVALLSTLAAAAAATPVQSHARARLAALKAAGGKGKAKSTSTNTEAESDVELNASWAGAVVTGTGFTGVSASFTVPTPKIPTDGETSATYHTASSWIGMDGYNCDGGLWQAGVDGTIDSSGALSYYAWYEWYPENTVVIDLGDLAAGNVITVNITSSGDYTTGQIVMENQSNGQTFTKTVSDSDALCGKSIEWIMEDLSVDGDENGLANFGTLTFTDASGTSSSGTVSPSSAQLMDIETDADERLTESSVTSDTVVIVYQ